MKGVIIADNSITNQKIEEYDVKLLEIFADQAALAIDNAQLREKLRIRLQELEQAYNTLQESQRRLVEREKLASLGEMVAKIAHEIRNPLVSIGGFARNLLKSMPPDDKNRLYIDIIGKEALRLEDILSNILNYTRLFEPKKVRVK
ncbi:hypothetical protein DRQ09_08900 [candidate division KSB1 bacterium]|nr:MAG: hypothetical protein DRQ09_08900 [candidate division KSB1 bacterium]